MSISSVRARIFYLWRLAGTGFAFLALFVGAALSATLFMPLIFLLKGDRTRRVKAFILVSFRLYLTILEKLQLINIEINGKEKLRFCQGRMIIANHPTLLDTVVLMAIIPNAQCIVNYKLMSHRFLGGMVRYAGYIRNDLEPEKLIAACQSSLHDGSNLIIFPEGTRTRPGIAPHFNRGFAHLALMTRATIVPVIINCTPPTLCKGDPWWRIPEKKPVLSFSIQDEMDISNRYQHPSRGLNARKLVQDLELYYEVKLHDR